MSNKIVKYYKIGDMKKTSKKRKFSKIHKSLTYDPNAKIRKVRKYLSWDIQQHPDISNPYISLLNPIDEGVGTGERIGLGIVLTSIQYKGTIYPYARPGTVGTSMNNLPSYAISIVYDNEPHGALPTVSGANDSIYNGSDPHDLPLFVNSKRYTQVFNKLYTPKNPIVFQFNTSGTTSAVQFDFMDAIEEYKKIKLSTEYNSGTGVIGNITKGALYLILRTSAAVSVAPIDDRPLFNIDVRLRFTDV